MFERRTSEGGAPAHSTGDSQGAGEHGAAQQFTSRGSIPPVAPQGGTSRASASELAYEQPKPVRHTPADLGSLAYHARGRSVVSEARAIVALTSRWEPEDRVNAFRHQLRTRASSPLFQAALMRALDGAAAAALASDPQGLDIGRLQSDVAELTDAEQAAAGYNVRWQTQLGLVWREAYFAAYISRHGARSLALKLGPLLGPSVGMVAQAIGCAQRDGMISAASAMTLTARDTMLDGAVTVWLTTPLVELRKQLDAAQNELEGLELRLQEHLQDIGPALYDANEPDPANLAKARKRVQEYVKTFRSSGEYKAAKARAAAAAKALRLELDAVGGNMLAYAGLPESGPAMRTMLLDDYQALATTPDGALEAVQWAEAHATDAAFTHAERQRLALISEIGQDTVASAALIEVQAMMQAAQDAKGNDRQEAFRQAIELLRAGVYKPLSQIRTLKGVSDLGKRLDELRTNAQVAAALASGDHEKALAVARTFIEKAPPKASPVVTRVWAAFGSMLGMFNSGAATQSSDPKRLSDSARGIHGSLLKLKELLATADNTPDVQKQALDLVDNIKGGFRNFRTMGFGVLGITSSLLSLDDDLRRAQERPDNLALQLQVATRIALLVGSTLYLFPPLAPLGMIITTCAQAITFVIGFFVGDPEGDARRSQEREILAQPAVLGDAALAQTFTYPHAAGNLAAAQAGGMTTAQIHALGSSRPWVFERQDFVSTLDTLRQWLGRHPELGRYTSAPTLNEFLSELDERTLEDLRGFATPHVDEMRRDEPFGGGEEYFIATTVQYYLGFYVFGSA